jgi:hypothetical protein
MYPGTAITTQIAIDAFTRVIEDARVAVSLGFGSAISAAREADRASAALYQATTRRNTLTQRSSVAEHVSAELEVDRWRQYVIVHSAIALEGALVVFNSIDLALKDYARNRYGAPDRRWITGGPSFGATPRTLFEIIRALCNYFRHREEWLANQGLRQAVRSMAVLNDLGINPLSSSAHLAVLLLLQIDTWLDLESILLTAICAIP